MRTLIIDDEQPLRSALYKVFSSLGVCDQAEDGAQGLMLIKMALEKEPYDLIVLDIVLPELSGQRIIKKLRELEAKAGIDPLKEAKVVVVSGRQDEPTLLQAFRNGATGWVNKPINPAKLLNNLKNLKIS